MSCRDFLLGADVVRERACVVAELRRHAAHYEKWKRPDLAQALLEASEVIEAGMHAERRTADNSELDLPPPPTEAAP